MTDDEIIDKIQEVRKANNIAWMDILRLAFETNKIKAKHIFSQITKNDSKINELSKMLCE
jgi:hypothetical protein